MSEKIEEKKSINKKLVFSLAGAFLAIVLVIAALAWPTEGIASGISIEGVPVSGMSVEEAVEALSAKNEKQVPDEQITVHFDGKDYSINFSDAMTGYDIQSTVEKAYDIGRNKNVLLAAAERVVSKFDRKNILLIPSVNGQYIEQFTHDIVSQVENPKTDDYYFMEEDKLKLVFGNAGNFVDYDKLLTGITEFLTSGESGEISLEIVFAQPKEFDVDEIHEKIAVAPVNTSHEEKDGKKYIVKAQNGYRFDKKELEAAIKENKGVNDNFYFLPEVITPDNTVLDETGLFTEVLAQYTSKITDQDSNRLNNVHLAANKINGVVINPGDIFAYLSYVEPITVAGGYKSANVYANGKILKDIGGGVCQVSSALYSAVLNANLEIVKRYAHSLTVAYVPLGQDATVASGEIDFRFRNNTNEPVKVVASSDNKGVYIKLLGKKVDPSVTVQIENVTSAVLHPETVYEEDETLEPGKEVVDYAGKTGYVIQTYKHIYKDGALVETVHVSTSRYKKIDKTIRRGPVAEETGAETTEGEMAEENEAPSEEPEEESRESLPEEPEEETIQTEIPEE